MPPLVPALAVAAALGGALFALGTQLPKRDLTGAARIEADATALYEPRVRPVEPSPRAADPEAGSVSMDGPPPRQAPVIAKSGPSGPAHGSALDTTASGPPEDRLPRAAPERTRASREAVLSRRPVRLPFAPSRASRPRSRRAEAVAPRRGRPVRILAQSNVGSIRMPLILGVAY